MVKRALLVSCAAIMAGTATYPAAASPWVRGFVVGYYNYAFRYGGRPDYQRGAYIKPGVDCPKGNAFAFFKPEDMVFALSLVSWRTRQEIDAIANPVTEGPKPVAGQVFGPYRLSAQYRGYKPGIQTYVNPFAADDPGQPEVVSRVGEGFNLDGKIKPSDFVSPDGEKGIDNALYRAWGCTGTWRGEDGTMVLRSNDKMTQGMYTIVARLSGNKDPMNDDQATLEIGYSPDKIMKDSRGNVAADYSYRFLKSEMYSKLKARIKDGVVQTEQASEIHMPEMAWWPNQVRDADFHRGKISLVLNADKTATGLVGGYRDWRDLYAQETYSQDGGQQGVREHEDHVALYFAMRRNADGMLNPKTGRYDGISSVYRMKLVPAFVVDPNTPMQLTFAGPDLPQIKRYNDTRLAMIKGADTLVPQPPPPENGTGGEGFDRTRPYRGIVGVDLRPPTGR